MATRKGMGGPKTKAGKAKSSLNAIKFGVSTFRPIDDEESQLVQHFTQELIDFYQPESPLEIMQLERIALCRAKLARLYQIERARLQLTKNAINANPEKLLDQLGIQNGLAKKFAQEQIQYQIITLPLHLTLKSLMAIAQEVQLYTQNTLSENGFKHYLPVLYDYVTQNTFLGIEQGASALAKLQSVLQKLQKVLESDNPPIGRVAQLLDTLLQKQQQNRGHESEEDQDVRDLMIALNPDYANSSAQSMLSNRMAKENDNIERVDVPKILNNLEYFSQLLAAVKQAQKWVEYYEQSKALIENSLVLPQSDADLLLRYQTTWERRLSTEVGEFIELRKHGHSSA